MEPEPAASTAAASTEEATAPAVPQEFEIPAIIAQMVAADASETYVFKQFNYTVDKHVKFDVTAADTWQSLTETFDWAQKETGSCQDATYGQFLKEVASRAKKGHYIFNDDETLKDGDMSSVFFKAKPGWKDHFGRNLPESDFMENVKPLLKPLGKYMFQNFKKTPADAMARTWDHQDLIDKILQDTWKHKAPPNFGWTVEKLHRALIYDPNTYESDPVAHTCKFLDWNNVVNYHLEKDFDATKPSGEWAQAAPGKGGQQHSGTDWSNWTPAAAKGKGKGPGRHAANQGPESAHTRGEATYKGSSDSTTAGSYNNYGSWGQSSSSTNNQVPYNRGNKGKGTYEQGGSQQGEAGNWYSFP